MQLATFAASQSSHSFHRAIGMLQQLANFLEKKFSFGRERYAAPAAVQKGDPYLILQVVDLPAQRRLRDSESRGGFGQVPRVANRQKVSQVPKFHGAILSCRKGTTEQQT
jgi:hypothetical protein